MAYNVHYKDKWDFEGWHAFCNHVSVQEIFNIYNCVSCRKNLSLNYVAQHKNVGKSKYSLILN